MLNAAEKTNPRLQKIPLNSSHLTLYVEGEQGLVYHHLAQTLDKLPALSVALLLAIDSGFSQQECVEQVSQLSLLSCSEIEKSYQQVKKLFASRESTQSYLDGRYPELSNCTTPVQKKVPYVSYQIAGTTFAIYAEQVELNEEITKLLAPVVKQDSEVDFLITVSESDDNLYSLIVNELEVETKLSLLETMPALIDRMQVLAFQNSDYDFCFHSAALTCRCGSLLLPASSGSGKSTLAAELATNNYQLFSDEMSALNDGFSLLKINLPIVVKEGSWQHLSKHYPELEHSSIWQRIDGRRLKYLWPKEQDEHDFLANKKEQIDKQVLLVSPSYVDEESEVDSNGKGNAVIAPVSIIDMLEILTASGYQVGQSLTPERLEKLLLFVGQSRRYKLSYSNSGQALKALEQLWQK